MTQEPLRLFVAMPGTSMGASAEWTDPEQIKAHFYEKVRDRLARRLDRPVELVIEKDKVLAGPIHASMFKEAMKADVYISDLTGNNANVYLELGARWASRDSVTVIVSQDVSDVLFNAAASRAIPYGKDPDSLKTAIDETTTAIMKGLSTTDYCDSPVRQGATIVTYDRDAIHQLREENTALKRQRGDDLFSAAIGSPNPEERLRLLRDAAAVNPSRSDVLIALGTELRQQAQYDESAHTFQRATQLNPQSSDAHRELGVTYGKLKKHEMAVQSLNESVRLAPDDAESLRTCGGALRRWGMRDAPNVLDWDALNFARDRYASAGKLDPYDTYALLNVAKLDMILSKTEPTRLTAAQSQFKKLQPLCQFNVSDDPTDSWRKFDLADSHLFSGDYDTAATLYADAIDSVPEKHKQSVLSTVIGPLQQLLLLDVLSGDLKTHTQDTCEILTEHMPQTAGG